MTTTVCADENEFQVDDGQLGLRICGDPAHSAWPYDADSSTHNPLRVDAGCGLWVPFPADAALPFIAQFEDSTNHTIDDSGFTNILTASFDVTNPSDVLQAVALIAFEVQVNWHWPTVPGIVDAYRHISIRVEYDDGSGGGYSAGDRILYQPSRWGGSTEVLSFPESWSYEGARRMSGMTPGEVRHAKFRFSASLDNVSGVADCVVTDTTLAVRPLVVTQT